MKIPKKKEKELLEKIKEIKTLEAESKKINKEIDGIKGEIKAFMEEKDVAELAVDIFTVRYADVTTSRFDTTAFKKTHEELYQQYSKPSVSKRFEIK